MKRRRIALLIIGAVLVISVAAVVIATAASGPFHFKAGEIECITLVSNELSDYGKAKLITNPEDIKTICNAFGATDIYGTEEWKQSLLTKDGGGLLTYQLSFSSGTTKVIDYYDGEYLVMDEVAYKIQSFALGNFWQLDYPVQNLNAAESSAPMVSYTQNDDGTFSTADYTYKYRILLTGRLPKAAVDSSYTVLTNNANVTFDEVAQSLYSSNTADWLDISETIIVDMK